MANSFKKKENLDKKYFVGDDDLLYENQISEEELSLGQKSKNFDGNDFKEQNTVKRGKVNFSQHEKSNFSYETILGSTP